MNKIEIVEHCWEILRALDELEKEAGDIGIVEDKQEILRLMSQIYCTIYLEIVTTMIYID